MPYVTSCVSSTLWAITGSIFIPTFTTTTSNLNLFLFIHITLTRILYLCLFFVTKPRRENLNTERKTSYELNTYYLFILPILYNRSSLNTRMSLRLRSGHIPVDKIAFLMKKVASPNRNEKLWKMFSIFCWNVFKLEQFDLPFLRIGILKSVP